MLREFAEVVDTLTAETPLVLIFEDLHWSDYATLDLLALLARRRTPARLLVIGTYRPVEAIVHHHPLRTVVQDLQRHGHATALPLALLSAEAVAAYLAALSPAAVPGRAGAVAAPGTDGQPLFLVTLVQALVERGVLREQDGRWTVQGDIEALALECPRACGSCSSSRSRLPLEAQRVLEVASGGVEFVAAAVAAGLEAEADAVEEHCEALWSSSSCTPGGDDLAQRDGDGTLHLRACPVSTGSVRAGGGRRVRLHQRLGVSGDGHGAQAGEIAAELAEHFVRGQDPQRAVHYLHQAARMPCTAVPRWKPSIT